jgi:hypothetical protein
MAGEWECIRLLPTDLVGSCEVCAIVCQLVQKLSRVAVNDGSGGKYTSYWSMLGSGVLLSVIIVYVVYLHVP